MFCCRYWFQGCEKIFFILMQFSYITNVVILRKIIWSRNKRSILWWLDIKTELQNINLSEVFTYVYVYIWKYRSIIYVCKIHNRDDFRVLNVQSPFLKRLFFSVSNFIKCLLTTDGWLPLTFELKHNTSIHGFWNAFEIGLQNAHYVESTKFPTYVTYSPLFVFFHYVISIFKTFFKIHNISA